MRRASLALVLLLAGVACGSGSTKEFIAPAELRPGYAPTASAAPVATDPVTGAPVARGSRRPAGAMAAPSSGPRSVAGGDGSGTTLPPGRGPIKIGFHYSENLDTAYRALGASGSFVNVVVAIESMVKYVNANGGLGGKTIVPVVHGTDPLNGTFSSQAETACTRFAQDEKVFATVQGAVLPDINSAACHTKYKSPLVWSYQYILDREALIEFNDFLYMPQAIGVDRHDFYVDALWSSGFLSKASKVGLFRYDDPVHERFLNAVVKPGLAKKGLSVIDKPLRRPQSAGEAGEVGAQAANAMVDFRRNGVDRVLFIPSGGAIPFIVGPVAENQRYYPRMAFTSFDIPTFLTDNLSDETLEGAVTLGWMPTNDTYLQYVPKDPDLERCVKAAGVRDASVVRFCDGLFLLDQALDKTPKFSPQGLQEAVHALGTGFKTPWSFTSKMGPDRHDGASSFRLMRFNAPCSCFRYEGASKPVP